MNRPIGRHGGHWSLRTATGNAKIYPLAAFASSAYNPGGAATVTATASNSIIVNATGVVVYGMIIEATVAVSNFTISDAVGNNILSTITATATQGVLPRFVPFGPKGMYLPHGIGFASNNTNGVATLIYDVVW